MQTIETFLIGNTMEPLQRMFRCERKNMLRCPVEELPGVKVPLDWSSGSDGGTFAVCVSVCTRQALSFISLPFFNTLPGILVSSAGSVQVSFPSHCWNGLPGLLFSWSQHVSLQGLQVCARQGVSGYERPPAHSYGESGVPARAEAVPSLLGGFASVETQPAAHAVVLCVSKGIGRCLGS